MKKVIGFIMGLILLPLFGIVQLLILGTEQIDKWFKK